jgi:hypothetical protein
MADGQVDFRLRSPFGDVEIELHPPAVDPAERAASLRELSRLVSDFKYRQPEARRVLLAVYARLGGLTASEVGQGYDFDTGSPRADAIGAELMRQARAGNLVVRRKVTRSVVIPLDVAAEPVLGPESVAETDWVQFEVLDEETGAPISGVRLAATLPDGSKATLTSAGDGSTPVKQTVSGACSVQLDADNLTTVGYPSMVDPPPPLSFSTGQVSKILLKKPILQLLHLYHDEAPVQGAAFTVVLTNGQKVQGNLDENGKASVLVTAPASKVQFGPDVRPWDRVDQTKNPDFADDIDADSFVAARFSAGAGQS